jgi:hypothetical protein
MTSGDLRERTELSQIEANIERFRWLLREGNFAFSQRDVIEELLAEETAKLHALTRTAKSA